jgi:hypothetical protein
MSFQHACHYIVVHNDNFVNNFKKVQFCNAEILECGILEFYKNNGEIVFDLQKYMRSI